MQKLVRLNAQKCVSTFNDFILPVKIFDAVDHIVKINGKRNTIEALVANAASETSWMVKLTHSL